MSATVRTLSWSPQEVEVESSTDITGPLLGSQLPPIREQSESRSSTESVSNTANHSNQLLQQIDDDPTSLSPTENIDSDTLLPSESVPSQPSQSQSAS